MGKEGQDVISTSCFRPENTVWAGHFLWLPQQPLFKKKKKSYGDRETSEWAHKVPLVDTHFLPVIQLTTVLGTAVNFTDVIKVPNQLTLREGMDPVASELVT